jgi:HD superfamily phosphohydrolase
MEIRDPVHGNIDIHPKMEAVMSHPVYQRLRQIKQLGFGEFSYPGATHNRFMHSLGVSYNAGRIFDSIFKGYNFSKATDKWRLRETTVLAALLHDIGHGPLSHTTEEVMPKLSELKIPCYKHMIDRRANHEDYTIKFVTDSDLSRVITENYPDISPYHIACLIDKTLPVSDDFFLVDGLDFRPILTQIISSELDADRMDYLVRDSYYTGTSYGHVDMDWIISNLAYHVVDGALYLALNRRALYTFDDFLISRHHMYLQVYFHHRCIVYDEMLNLYLTSSDCDFRLPADINEYLRYTDYLLYEHLRTSKNYWAKLISDRKPYRVTFELHSLADNDRIDKMQAALEKEGFSTIQSNSQTRLSKYHATSPDEHLIHKIYVIDQFDKLIPAIPIEETTQIFKMYEGTRRVERLYVPSSDVDLAKKFIERNRL